MKNVNHVHVWSQDPQIRILPTFLPECPNCGVAVYSFYDRDRGRRSNFQCSNHGSNCRKQTSIRWGTFLFNSNMTYRFVDHITKPAHTYPLEFLLNMTWPMIVVYYKVNYLPVGVRIWFHPNCRVGVFRDMVNFLNEIG